MQIFGMKIAMLASRTAVTLNMNYSEKNSSKKHKMGNAKLDELKI